LERKGYPLDAYMADLGKTLGEELLTPTKIYVKPILELCGKITPSAMAHITGGGFIGNIPRVLPDTCAVSINQGSWDVPAIFRIIASEANLADDEMFRTFNMGIGMVLVVPADQSQAALANLAENGLDARAIGEVQQRGAGGQAVSFR